MKFLVVLAVSLAIVASVPLPPTKDDVAAPIIRSSYDLTPEGAFEYSYETGNGINAQASGYIKNPNDEYPILEVRGGYKYTSPEGIPIEVTYISNENGFQASGKHLPQGPEAPAYVAKTLEYNAVRSGVVIPDPLPPRILPYQG